ncbi:MAG: hypothetical protein J2P54_08045 [Bradyrhizobiaceae bacterium]|nr:hypothetical protein [Bradyrhizobiaceae bacterium]
MDDKRSACRGRASSKPIKSNSSSPVSFQLAAFSPGTNWQGSTPMPARLLRSDYIKEPPFLGSEFRPRGSSSFLGVFGTLGDVWGPVLGAFLIIPAENFIRASLGGVPGAHLVVLGLLLMLASLFLKRGVAGAAATLWRRAGTRRTTADFLSVCALTNLY